jgi:hypothetical protein
MIFNWKAAGTGLLALICILLVGGALFGLLVIGTEMFGMLPTGIAYVGFCVVVAVLYFGFEPR